MSADPGPLKRDLNSASTSVQSFSASITQTSSLIKGAFAAAVGGAGALAIGKMITGASDLAENVGKIGAIFGDQGSAVEADARKMADAFGVSINGMLDGAGKLGGLFKGAGFSAQATADLSKSFNRLTLDASRFFNVPYDVAFQKIRSGLAGEAEPLRDFGIFLTADKIKAQALAMGLAGLNGELSDQAKITATAAIIQTGLADAQGNAAATASGAAAQIEGFKGRIENLMATFGEGLAPIAGSVLEGVSTAISAMTNTWNESKAGVLSWASGTIEALGLAGGSINAIEVAVGFLANAWQAVSLAFQFTQGVFQGVVTAIIDGIAHAAKAFDWLVESVTGASTGIGEKLTTIADSMKNSLAVARKEMVAEWNKPWASNAVSETFQKARDDLKSLQNEIGATPKITPTLATGPAGKAKAKDPFAGAQLAGSKEAASTILRSRYGSTGKDGAAASVETAANTRQALAVQKAMLAALRSRQDGLEVISF